MKDSPGSCVGSVSRHGSFGALDSRKAELMPEEMDLDSNTRESLRKEAIRWESFNRKAGKSSGSLSRRNSLRNDVVQLEPPVGNSSKIDAYRRDSVKRTPIRRDSSRVNSILRDSSLPSRDSFLTESQRNDSLQSNSVRSNSLRRDSPRSLKSQDSGYTGSSSRDSVRSNSLRIDSLRNFRSQDSVYDGSMMTERLDSLKSNSLRRDSPRSLKSQDSGYDGGLRSLEDSDSGESQLGTSPRIKLNLKIPHQLVGWLRNSATGNNHETSTLQHEISAKFCEMKFCRPPYP
jgi:hypothetical protein